MLEIWCCIDGRFGLRLFDGSFGANTQLVDHIIPPFFFFFIFFFQRRQVSFVLAHAGPLFDVK